MVTLELVSRQDCTVGGIGLLPAGKRVRVTDEQLIAFEAVHGYPLKEAKFTSGVEVWAVVEKDEEDEGGE